LLGRYDQASWSPFGRFVAATRGDEVVAMDPAGRVHWVLGTPVPRFPAWGGTRTDTRIAYLSGERLRIVAGDGTGDAAGCPGWVPIGAAWQPGSTRILAYATLSRVVVVETRTCKPLFARNGRAAKLQWSSDGKLLLAFAPKALRVYDSNGRVVARDDPSDATRDVDATFLPGTHEVAVLRLHGASTSLFMLSSGRNLFSAGALRQVVASPDGRWLLVTWPAADQWVFVRVAAPHTIRAYSQIRQQFGRRTFPEVSGWIGH
jgi:hypothetical protein